MFIAERLKVLFEPVVYANQEAYAQSFGKDEWDIAIGVRDSAVGKADLAPDFMLADAQYIAGPGRAFADSSQVDRSSVKVAFAKGGGSEQILRRLLKSAELVPVTGGVHNAIEALRTGKADVWAANPVTLRAIGDGLPGSTIIPGAYATGRYAVIIPKGRSLEAQRVLAEIVQEAKLTGIVQQGIDKAGFEGVRVAPQ